MSDTERAKRVAAEIMAEHGAPTTYEQMVARIAFAYLIGNRDGYSQCAEQIDAMLVRSEEMLS